MQVLLPPSETKARGGRGPATDLLALRFPELRSHREAMLTALIELSARPDAARFALKVTAAKDDEVRQNVTIRSAPTMPALDRYTGVLYAALDAATMSIAERARASRRVIVMSALFGPIGGGDLIPAYRLSAGTAVPRLGAVSKFWSAVTGPLLAAVDEPVLDLRSTAYRGFGVVPGAITVRAVAERPDGTRVVISHFNKQVKGRLARLIATTRRDLDTVEAVIDAARAGSLRAEQSGPQSIELIA